MICKSGLSEIRLLPGRIYGIAIYMQYIEAVYSLDCLISLYASLARFAIRSVVAQI